MATTAVQPETVVIILLLIGAFLVAYKILKMLMETAFVSFISAVFYASLAVIMGYTITFDRILSFAFMGATLYMVYSVAASTFKGFSRILSFLSSAVYQVIEAVKPDISSQERRIKKLEKKIEDYRGQMKSKRSNSRDESNDEDPDTVKEVVLDNKEED